LHPPITVLGASAFVPLVRAKVTFRSCVEGFVWLALVLGAVVCVVSSDIRPSTDADLLRVELSDARHLRKAICRPPLRQCQVPQRQAELRAPLSLEKKLIESVEKM